MPRVRDAPCRESDRLPTRQWNPYRSFLGSSSDSLLEEAKFAGRLPRAAAKPSRTSASLKPRNSSASEVSKLGPARRSQLLRACLVKRTAVALPAASERATSNADATT